MTPTSQDISDHVVEQNNDLKRQLNEEMRKRNYLMEEVKNFEYQNDQLRNNQGSSYKINSLRSENQRLRDQIERKKKEINNVPQHLVE